MALDRSALRGACEDSHDAPFPGFWDVDFCLFPPSPSCQFIEACNSRGAKGAKGRPAMIDIATPAVGTLNSLEGDFAAPGRLLFPPLPLIVAPDSLHSRPPVHLTSDQPQPIASLNAAVAETSLPSPAATPLLGTFSSFLSFAHPSEMTENDDPDLDELARIIASPAGAHTNSSQQLRPHQPPTELNQYPPHPHQTLHAVLPGSTSPVVDPRHRSPLHPFLHPDAAHAHSPTLFRSPTQVAHHPSPFLAATATASPQHPAARRPSNPHMSPLAASLIPSPLLDPTTGARRFSLPHVAADPPAAASWRAATPQLDLNAAVSDLLSFNTHAERTVSGPPIKTEEPGFGALPSPVVPQPFPVQYAIQPPLRSPSVASPAPPHPSHLHPPPHAHDPLQLSAGMLDEIAMAAPSGRHRELKDELEQMDEDTFRILSALADMPLAVPVSGDGVGVGDATAATGTGLPPLPQPSPQMQGQDTLAGQGEDRTVRVSSSLPFEPSLGSSASASDLTALLPLETLAPPAPVLKPRVIPHKPDARPRGLPRPRPSSAPQPSSSAPSTDAARKRPLSAPSVAPKRRKSSTASGSTVEVAGLAPTAASTPSVTTATTADSPATSMAPTPSPLFTMDAATAGSSTYLAPQHPSPVQAVIRAPPNPVKAEEAVGLRFTSAGPGTTSSATAAAEPTSDALQVMLDAAVAGFETALRRRSIGSASTATTTTAGGTDSEADGRGSGGLGDLGGTVLFFPPPVGEEDEDAWILRMSARIVVEEVEMDPATGREGPVRLILGGASDVGAPSNSPAIDAPNAGGAAPPPRVTVGGRKVKRTFLCPIERCGLRAKRRYNVQTHLRTHLPDAARRRAHACAQCGRKYLRFYELERHWQRKGHQGQVGVENVGEEVAGTEENAE
ncbi:hypothetical protein HDU96_009419 [Phlyctochytrium bullatum]|nr:hypothetical protein HDU96_009419 [Phlyctochytrium bullatum]